MPVFRSYTWRNCKITIRPTGIRRFFSFIPYLYGTDGELKIHILNTSDNEVQFNYKWELQILLGNTLVSAGNGAGEITVKPRSEETARLYIGYLWRIGYFMLGMWETHESKRHAVANFSVLDRDSIVMKVILAILAVIATALIGIFVKLLLG